MVSVSACLHALSHVSNNHCSTTLSFCSCVTQFSVTTITVNISRCQLHRHQALRDDFDNAEDSTLTESTATVVPTFETELDNDLREPRVPHTTDIYGLCHCSQFPGLEPAARKVWSAPPTSVASEQLFSATGQIYSDRRSSLLGENAEKLLFLAYNI